LHRHTVGHSNSESGWKILRAHICSASLAHPLYSARHGRTLRTPHPLLRCGGWSSCPWAVQPSCPREIQNRNMKRIQFCDSDQENEHRGAACTQADRWRLYWCPSWKPSWAMPAVRHRVHRRQWRSGARQGGAVRLPHHLDTVFVKSIGIQLVQTKLAAAGFRPQN